MSTSVTPTVTERMHALIEQTVALADILVPDVGTASEAVALVDLIVRLDLEVRERHVTPFSGAIALRTTAAVVTLVSELYGRVPCGHPASGQALGIVATTEGIAWALRQEGASLDARRAYFARARPRSTRDEVVPA